MRRLLLALTALVPMTARAQQAQSQLEASDIQTALTGNTLTGISLTNPTLLGAIAAASSGSLSVAANNPLSGIYLAGAGSQVSMCPGYNFGCPSVGHINAQTASVATSLGDAGVQESGIYSYLVNQTGQAFNWAASTGYNAGQVVIANGGSGLYVETASSCTSATFGAGPIGTGAGISDGTCLWTNEGEPGLRGKIGIASTTLVLPGGTDAWAAAFDTFIYSGWAESFAAGTEVDVTNNSGRDATGMGTAPTVDDLYLGGSVGANPITSYVEVSPFGLMGTNFMAHEGIWTEGQYTIKDHDFRVSTHSTDAFYDEGVHGTASYFDSSTSPSGVLLEGNYSSGNALVADASIAAVKTASGTGFTGLTVTNFGTTPTTTDANIMLNTGNAGSYARFDVFDSNSLNIQTGAAMPVGITLGTLAGPINLNPHTTLAVNGVAGVSCAAGTVSLSTLTVTAGLVTHC